jgi:RecG-like helicase
MFILNKTLISDLKVLNPTQKKLCLANNISFLGDILAISPSRLDIVENFSGIGELNKVFQAEFEIFKFVYKKSSKGRFYFQIYLISKYGNYQAFLFSNARFLFSQLKIGRKCWIDFKFFNNSLSNLVIQKIKFSLPDPDSEPRRLILKYQKTGTLDSNSLTKIHQKLPAESYLIDLSETVPKNLFGQNTLNLGPLHHPLNVTEFNEANQKLIKLKIFIQTCLLRKIDWRRQNNKTSFRPDLSLDILKSSSSNLGFDLTPSQKLAIWEVLKDTTQNWEKFEKV